MAALAKVVCKEDHDAITHKMTKGKQYDIPAGHAETLEKEGIVEIIESPRRATKELDVERRLKALEETKGATRGKKTAATS